MYENSRPAIQVTDHKSPSLDFKDIHLNFSISPKSGCQSDGSREVSYFKYEFFMMWVYLCGKEHLGKDRWVSQCWNRNEKILVKVHLSEVNVPAAFSTHRAELLQKHEQSYLVS